MSEARMSDMAVIDAALMGPQTIDADALVGEQPTEQHVAIQSPLSDIAKELSAKEQKEAAKINLAGGAGTSYGPSVPQEQVDAEKEQFTFQQKQQSLLKQKAQATAQSAGRALGSVQNGLGSISMPGGILTPLLILLTFYMLLVSVNGHTRLTWLWLVVTQNAAIPGNLNIPGSQASLTENLTPGQSASLNNGTGGGMPPVMSLRAYVPLDMDEW